MDPLEETIAYYDANAPAFAQRWFGSDVMHEDLQRFVKNLQGVWVLSAGCGAGRDELYLTKLGLEVDGIDLSEKLLEIARKHAPEATFFNMDMRFLLFPEEFYNGVWCCASLLHIPRNQVLGTLKEFWRVLVPRGILYVSVKEGEGDEWDVREDGRLHYTYFQEEELRSLIEGAGFEIFHFYKAVRHATLFGVFARKVGG